MKSAVIPAILQTSFEGIVDSVQRVDDLASYVQVDVVDGVFAGAPTWPFTDSADIADLVSRLDTLSVDYELDLMIERPEKTLATWLTTVAQRFIIHFSSTDQLSHCIAAIRQKNREVYVGLCIDDHIDSFSPFLDSIDGVQCMGIAQIGAQGEPYDDRVERLVRSVREAHPTLSITVDGGVSLSHIPALLDAGVTQVAVGSALFSGDIDANFALLSEAMQNR